MTNFGLKKLEQRVWSMTVLRIGVDSDNIPFVVVRINETGEERRLYVKDNLEMHFDLTKEELDKDTDD